ncbi:enoyl-CoA hydratase/isomerase family protein [Pseudoruegeria sp. SHC-113]|uniref:enoyl-CoA hydratase/isomerase family protein n=1 Tax=Pseudoruegeria sp. SHC-113 TaxID=2855439 RepID=UPI0021BA8F8A|nr:enoyl-CoA hydratase/isomerase family protein [Pseudoruegeria sp. SHC-113]MCT8161729.1 enoyl-CoA hydratase/isomerase family protein [Pseudoruegeria sp. SHC-113]
MSTPPEGRVWLHKDGPIGEITLDRPAKLNALTPQMYRQIAECCAQADADAEIRVVIFRGEGSRAFCAGSDVKALEGYEDFWAWRNRFDYIPPILALRKPAIAAVKGWALGGGLEIALACDLRVVARDAVFSAPEVQLGWNGAGGAAQHLTRMCGYGQAMRILLTGDRFDAEEAARIGMVEYLVDPGEELPRARALAAQIADHAPHATQAVKAAVRGAMDLTTAQGLRNENELMSLCFAKADLARAKAAQETR